ncbi:3-oxoacyl-ACP reductase FabG [Pseudoxanthomonas sp.]|uniref:3-oxoacyl-ACP reductase FabG n=1 Tax=Pseudoxanthomonas sp. TaxID=1871049 RepID=UPI0026221EEF|nr:3-oxoacyl-ACP reductase FabG [Pseudoxanthomonas sp.]WDS35414.1 MAG: 3-oxoacyl-ACP reductase FabG [Pseudoxanthomonas sp.]
MTPETIQKPQRRALVTGGSGDLGGAICLALGAAGFHVIVHANIALPRAQSVVDGIVQAGGRAEAVAFDVADADASASAMASLLEAGPIQVVVNNAGIHDDAPMAGMTAQQWHRVIDVSLHGFFNVTQPLLLPMARTRWGRVVCVSSVAAVTGNRGQTNYAAAKSALHGATKSLAREMASRGITANVVAPGVIESAMVGEQFPPEVLKQIVPAARAGKPDEVAALVAFLCSDAAGYINGQVIGINGGMG